MTTQLHQPTDRRTAEEIADRMHLIGHPMRIHLLMKLRDGPATARELRVKINGSHTSVVHHLRALHHAGFLHRTGDGATGHYRLRDESALDIYDAILHGLRTRSTTPT